MKFYRHRGFVMTHETDGLYVYYCRYCDAMDITTICRWLVPGSERE